MGWGRKKSRGMDRHSRDLDARITELRTKISRLETELERGDPARMQSVLCETENPKPTKRKVDSTEVLNLTHPRPAKPKRDNPDLYNESGVRKFDLAGSLQHLRKQVIDDEPEPGTESRLYTFIPADTIDGQPALGIEKRKARNRFIFLFLIFLAILWSVLTLLIPQL
jgi:hypothetical protein